MDKAGTVAAPSDRVHVAVRVRPFLPGELKADGVHWSTSGDSIELHQQPVAGGSDNCLTKFAFGELPKTFWTIKSTLNIYRTHI